MGNYTLALQLLGAQKARFGRVDRSMAKNHERLAMLGREDLEELTEGTISSRTLRQLGHPFARSAAGARRALTPKRSRAMGRFVKKGTIPLRPINVQSGDLRRSVFLSRPSRNVYDVGATTPYSKYVLHPAGTRRMVGRGVMTGHALGRRTPFGEIEKRFRARLRILRDAFKTSNRSQT